MEKIIYLDNAATTRTAPEVRGCHDSIFYRKVMVTRLPYIASAAAEQRVKLQNRREIIAECIWEHNTDEIYFTAGGIRV